MIISNKAAKNFSRRSKKRIMVYVRAIVILQNYKHIARLIWMFHKNNAASCLPLPARNGVECEKRSPEVADVRLPIAHCALAQGSIRLKLLRKPAALAHNFYPKASL